MALTLLYNIQPGQGCPTTEVQCGDCRRNCKCGNGRTKEPSWTCYRFPGLSGCYKMSTLVAMLNAAGNL